MSQHESGAAGPRRDRRRHAPARRGRGPVWLIAVGGVTVLGAAVALLSGGSGTKGGTGSPDGGSDGPPALIQPDPADPSASGDGQGRSSGPSDAGSGGAGEGAPSGSPGESASPSTPAGDEEPTAAPSGSGTAAPDAGTGTETTPTGDQSTRPGKGRGPSRRPR
ncbi:hypothetical protein ACWFR1_20230 [Streptomyces sp. NPDC055103]